MHCCCCSIDATDSHRTGRLVNHSMKPNAKPRIVWENDMPHICLFALVEIHIGDQILFNYDVLLLLAILDTSTRASPWQLNDIRNVEVVQVAKHLTL